MFDPRLRQRLLLPGLSPILQHFAAEFLQLFDGHRLGGIGTRALRDRLIHQVGYFLQASVRVRSLGKSFVQRLGC